MGDAGPPGRGPRGVHRRPAVLHAGKANLVLRPFVGRASVLLLDGPQHMRQRKLMLPPFHGSRMAGYRELVAEIAREHIAAWPRGRAARARPADAGDHARRRAARDLRRRRRARRGWTRCAAACGRCWSGCSAAPSMLALLDRRPGPRGAGAALPRWSSRRSTALLAEQIAERRADPGDDVLSLLLAARHEDGTPMSDHGAARRARHAAGRRATRRPPPRSTGPRSGCPHARRLGGAARRGRGVRRGRRQGGAAAAPGAPRRAAPPAGAD